MKWIDRVGRRVKLRDLHILLAVSQSGSITKAAEHLAVTYPVVSKTISDLEHTLGVRLFDRGIRGVEPTHYGRALLDSATAVFAEMKQGLNRIESIKNPGSGELRIGCSEPMAAAFVPAIIERFSKDYPRAVVYVLHSNIATLQYNDLRNRDTELVLGRIQTPFSEDDLELDILFDERMLVVAGMTNRWAKRSSVRLADLVAEPWILSPPGSLPRQLQEEVFHAAKLKVPDSNVLTLSIQLYTTMIATGHWFGLVPSSVMHFRPKETSVKILPVKVLAPAHPVGIVKVKNRTLSPLAERFVEYVHALAKPLANRPRGVHRG